MVKVIVTKVLGRDVEGYVYSDELTSDQLSNLGLDPEMPLGTEMLAVECNRETLECWAFYVYRGVRIEANKADLRYAIQEYIDFNPENLERDDYRFTNEEDL
jgi:hypothetical protein